MSQPASKGKVLMAEPFLEDPNFRRAAVMVCDYSLLEGTVGFVLNRPTDMMVDEVIEGFPEFEAEVFFGGPVKTDTIHYVHNVGNLLEGSTKIIEGVFWGGDFEKLKFLIEQELVLPENIRFFIGYSGWSAGQLENEIELGTWVLSDLHANYVFKTDPFQLWQQVLENKGEVYGVIGQMPDGTNLN